MLLWSGIVLAAPGDPIEDLAWRMARAEGEALVLGGSERSPWAMAQLLHGLPVDDPRWRVQAEWGRMATDPEDLALDGATIVALRGWSRGVAGNGVPYAPQGDHELGQAVFRAGAEAVWYHPWVEARLAVEGRVDGGPLAVDTLMMEYFVGLRRGPVRVGFGAEDRWLGPGRHGSLMLSSAARPFPAGVATVHGPVPRLGEARAEVGTGWLQLPRDDVTRPGVLWMDVRWAPVRYLEVGASRVSLFGGEGRPLPSAGQLLLPLDPHVEGDPDREEPDQDEIAALDVRVTAPFSGGYGAAWWQYGGDDMIVRNGLPSLAGVANLIGGEVAWGPVWLTVEYAALMDDRFRWYSGHRVYHQGFVQDGHPLGHPYGGDSVSLWAELGWQGARYGLRAEGEWVQRVGVVEVLGDQVFALASPETLRRGGVTGWMATGWGGDLQVGYSLGHRQGANFVPGAEVWEHRVHLTFRGAPWIAVGNEAPVGW